MKAHIDAIVALLEAVDLTVFYGDVPTEAALPYVLVWSSLGVPSDEAPLAGPDDLTDTVGVTSVASTASNVLLVGARARAALNGSLVVPGRAAWLDLFDSRTTQIDRDVTPHLAYGVDLYRLVSTPSA